MPGLYIFSIDRGILLPASTELHICVLAIVLCYVSKVVAPLFYILRPVPVVSQLLYTSITIGNCLVWIDTH